MGNLLKFLFGADKNKKMTEYQESTQEDLVKYSNLDFQWIKGENLSTIERFKGIKYSGDLTFIEFESGRRINKDLLDEFMVTFPAQPKLLPVPQEIPSQSKSQKSNPDSTVTSIVYGEEKNQDQDSPIYKLLRKQKKNMVEVQIKIKMNLPPKDLYNVLLGSFEDAEKEITQFVLDGVDIEDIKTALAESVKKNYYSTSKKNHEDKNYQRENIKTEEAHEE